MSLAVASFARLGPVALTGALAVAKGLRRQILPPVPYLIRTACVLRGIPFAADPMGAKP